MSIEWIDDSTKNFVRGPSWGELVDQATRILGFVNPDLARVRGTDLQILEYFRCKHSGQTAKLTNWLNKLMVPPDAALMASPIHSELAQLTQCSLFYTTNYDNFIERTFDLHGRNCNVVAVEAQMGRTPAKCQIIKFHGDLDHPDQIVLTESDYEKRLTLSMAMDHRLRSDLLGRVILFIGYSFRDPNVAYLFRLFTDHFREQRGGLPGKRAYIVVPDPSDFEVTLFGERHIEVIAVDGEKQAQEIATMLREMRS